MHLKNELLSLVGSTEGLTTQRCVEIYLQVMETNDEIRTLAECPKDLGRREWELANMLGHLVGLSPNLIRARSQHIRMKLIEAHAEALAQTRI